MFYDSLNRRVLQAEQGADGTFDPNVLALAAGGPSWQFANRTLITCFAYDRRGDTALALDPKGNSTLTVCDGAGTISRGSFSRHYR
jgi:hypothetical protein